MLRRTKTIVFNDEPDTTTYDDGEPAAAPSARRDLGARSGLRNGPAFTPREVPSETMAEPAPNPVHERMNFLRSEFEGEPITSGSQESLAALRAEFRRKHIENAADPNAGPSQPAFSLGGLKPSRIILLAVALVAGGIAAWLAIGRQPEIVAPPPVVEQAAPEPAPVAPTLDVLVARASIPVGTRLTPELLEWQKWPETTVRAEYLTSAAAPEAMTDLAGSVARTELVAGEPIRREKLGQAGAGYLSAILEPGKRAVAVAINPRSASGGFIMPNDRVDVVLTTTTATEQNSRTILENVRVLAINSRLGATEAEAAAAAPEESMFSDNALATLELDPSQAELIISAANGNLSLVLRPSADTAKPDDSARRAVNQTIRLTSPFWLQPPQPGSGGAAPAFPET
ncbi:MAG: Flp pilus assembly protein CpaB [Devosia sp.]